MKDIYDVSEKGLPKVGETISVGEESKEGIKPKCFLDTGEYYVKLQWIGGYYSGEWEIVFPDEPGIICFIPSWFADKKIMSVRIVSERPKSLVGKPIIFT